jgi:hypothetical protein
MVDTGVRTLTEMYKKSCPLCLGSEDVEHMLLRHTDNEIRGQEFLCKIYIHMHKN